MTTHGDAVMYPWISGWDFRLAIAIATAAAGATALADRRLEVRHARTSGPSNIGRQADQEPCRTTVSGGFDEFFRRNFYCAGPLLSTSVHGRTSRRRPAGER